VEEECGWMYETLHTDGKTKGKINYTVWSEVFSCPECAKEIIYFDTAVDKDYSVNDKFKCPHCGASLDKKSLQRQWVTYFDKLLGATHKMVRYKPVLINYQYGNNRYEKKPDAGDLELINKIEKTPIENYYPVLEMIEGERKNKDGYHLKGITHLHHFYFHRALLVYSRLWDKLSGCSSSFVKFFIQGNNFGFTKMNRYQPIQFGRVGGSQINRYFSGTLFVGSLISEVSPHYSFTNKLKRLSKLSLPGKNNNFNVSCQSTTNFDRFPNSSIDYAFIDPPFGNNLNYSELNFLWEAWLKILTQRIPEAVMDKGRNRSLQDYQKLMSFAFKELYRVIKPGRWITMEFHNSSNKVWMVIQETMGRAGFVVADVRTIDKRQETYKQSIQKLVKQDLVISAYKPNGGLEERFKLEAGTENGVWDFVRTHLMQLPIYVDNDGQAEIITERLNYLLFDRMVAFHIQRGIFVPISSGDFYIWLEKLFPVRSGMYFLEYQIAEFDKQFQKSKGILDQSLFVYDEVTAIRWLKNILSENPQRAADIQPAFMQEISGWNKNEIVLELKTLLEQNFLQDESSGKWRVPDPEKAADIEKLREKNLLREFEVYRSSAKKLKTFRMEAVRAGFKKAYNAHDYETIIKTADKLPADIIDEDPVLLMYYTSTRTRMGE
jgi:predicted RNA-binding Zn-ribbon protein involved in translation (DUF1610 family)